VELALTSEHARILVEDDRAKARRARRRRPAAQLARPACRDIRAGAARHALAEAAIVLGSTAGQLDVLRAFETGADDFLPLSAHYLELRARVRAILQRTESPPCRRALTVGPLAIDSAARTVSVEGRTVDLRRLEFDLLVHLVREPERVFARDELLGFVWGYRSYGSSRTVDSRASHLRRKLDVDGSHRWVINVSALGYRLI
jgi:DNA-binding response OmpR family regulator